MTDDDPKPIGKTVRALRVTAGLTQQQLADAMRGRGYLWTQRRVSTVEQGRESIAADEYQALQEILGGGIVDDEPDNGLMGLLGEAMTRQEVSKRLATIEHALAEIHGVIGQLRAIIGDPGQDKKG